MFRKSESSQQLNLFTSGDSLFSGKALTFYKNESAWHNLFRKEVTMRINEDLFKPLYSSNNGTPNSSIRVMISMMILKEAEGLSDQKLFEGCRYNMLFRSAIGLLNADDLVPTESTYYLFRKSVNDYKDAGNDNLFEKVFQDITKHQSLEFSVSGKRIRMDSKLLGSNIAWLSRYELIHETLRLFCKQIEHTDNIDTETRKQLTEIIEIKGNKVVYTSTNDEIKTKIESLGVLISNVLSIFSLSETESYQTLKRVFEEQFVLDENKIVIPKNKEDITAKSVQSPHDTDCHFRNKDGNKIKGYSINVTESCDDGDTLNLIGNVDVKEVSTPDVDFFQNGINKSQEVFSDKTEIVHTDGAYHNPSNQTFCKQNNITLHLHAIQGAKSRYDLNLLENGDLSVFDMQTEEFIEAIKIKTKKGVDKWRIKAGDKFRYFTNREIDTSSLRRKIKETPIETLQKRNNVEATIFQLAFHYPNAKSRYRGLIKHQMWANIRCLWVNFVRILKFTGKKWLNFTFHQKTVLNFAITKILLSLYSILLDYTFGKLFRLQNNHFIRFEK